MVATSRRHLNVNPSNCFLLTPILHNKLSTLTATSRQIIGIKKNYIHLSNIGNYKKGIPNCLFPPKTSFIDTQIA